MKVSCVGLVLLLSLAACGSKKPKSIHHTTEIDQAKVNELLQKHTCTACHKERAKLVGPPYIEIAKRNYSNRRIVELIQKPEPANWPDYMPMAGMPHIDEKDLLYIARWINSLK